MASGSEVKPNGQIADGSSQVDTGRDAELKVERDEDNDNVVGEQHEEEGEANAQRLHDSKPLITDKAPVPPHEPSVSGDHPPLPEEAPPLPDEEPPLPNEIPPDDGWEPVWDASANAFYFHNRITQATQWENPRLPALAAPPGLATHDRSSEDAYIASSYKKQRVGGYNPAIHGDYDPTADYAQADADSDDDQQGPAVVNADGSYEAAGAFNRFTGRWQAAEINPDNHNDENKSKRQMNAFFDVEAAANSHDGRSLKAERQSKKFSKKEIKAFKEKRRDRKEEKRRAWLRD